jgi:multicomponent Na+:H+ antiporter subunit B
MTTLLIGIFLLSLLVVTAFAIVRATDLFSAVMLSGIFSLLMALNFFILDAADVALTEAAVGGGVATVLLLAALRLTPPTEAPSRGIRGLSVVVVAVTTLLMIYASFGQPSLGDPDAPAHRHVAPWYIEQTPELIDIPNTVTAVLGSYRAYDTLGEAFVVLTAGIGVMFLLGGGRGKPFSGLQTGTAEGLSQHLIPKVVARILIPFILLFALFIQFHGEYSPGGGFQAGALFVAGMILFTLIRGERRSLSIIPPRALLMMSAGGALFYGVVGLAGIATGGQFLEYNNLASDPVAGQQLGILLIEFGVGVTVTGVLLSIFHAFIARD